MGTILTFNGEVLSLNGEGLSFTETSPSTMMTNTIDSYYFTSEGVDASDISSEEEI